MTVVTQQDATNIRYWYLDGTDKQILYTFEDMEVVKIFVADGFVVYEYTTDDGFAYAVTAV